MTFVDTNVLLDIFGDEPRWFDWSADRLREADARGPLLINDIIYAEVAVRFPTIEALDAQVQWLQLVRTPSPAPALFLAAEVFQAYRRAGGPRRSLLPDFFIGAQAVYAGTPLLTRDPRRYRTYFPTLELICP